MGSREEVVPSTKADLLVLDENHGSWRNTEPDVLERTSWTQTLNWNTYTRLTTDTRVSAQVHMLVVSEAKPSEVLSAGSKQLISPAA